MVAIKKNEPKDTFYTHYPTPLDLTFHMQP